MTIDFPTSHRGICASLRRSVTQPVSSAHLASASFPSVPSTTCTLKTLALMLRFCESGLMAFTLTNFGLRSVIFGGGLAHSAVIPGSSLPSRSSSDAPPPVLQWVTFSSVPHFLQHVAVSPPPMMVTTPRFVTFTTSSINAFVPFSKEAISKTPIGPFQIIVFALATTFALALMLSSPQSSPMKPSGIPSDFVALLISPSSPNLDEIVKSTGKQSSTRFSLALAMMSGTIFAPSSSKSESPIVMPSLTFRKV
mmetsp:Transcript_74084/g.214270  ORF Transcript_74084/g.214270 Transcript_74084/m.214270 type:complete len:252 (-) Transcript_74084:142-897(-)